MKANQVPTPPTRPCALVSRRGLRWVDPRGAIGGQALVRTVPMKYKQSIRDHLRPEGFYGFKLDELTPNKTRRAQCANWLLYYREVRQGCPAAGTHCGSSHRAPEEHDPPGFHLPLTPTGCSGQALHGVPLEELQRRKELERDVESENRDARAAGQSVKIARPDGKQAWELTGKKDRQADATPPS